MKSKKYLAFIASLLIMVCGTRCDWLQVAPVNRFPAGGMRPGGGPAQQRPRNFVGPGRVLGQPEPGDGRPHED